MRKPTSAEIALLREADRNTSPRRMSEAKRAQLDRMEREGTWISGHGMSGYILTDAALKLVRRP